MIKSIIEYKNKYIDLPLEVKLPGEHHFVCTYLIPQLFKYLKIIPFYINPDGMKNLVGDIVYFKKENKKIFSIEVKYEKIKFTKNQYNNWFKENESTKPDYLIAITKKSLFIINWNKFIDIYNNSINRNFKGNYSPEIKEIILISSCVKNVEFFDLEIDDKEIEIKINKILKNMTNKIKERMLYDK